MCDTQRPVTHTLCFYVQTSIFGAFIFFFFCNLHILTPLKSMNPCCALNTKRTRKSAACELNCSSSPRLQQLNSDFLSSHGFTVDVISCWSAEVMTMKMVLESWFYVPTQVDLLCVKDA